MKKLLFSLLMIVSLVGYSQNPVTAKKSEFGTYALRITYDLPPTAYVDYVIDEDGQLTIAGTGGDPAVIFDFDSASFTGTGGLILHRGSTAQRIDATNGMIRYNTSTDKFEAYEDGAWKDVITSSISLSDPGDDRLLGWDDSEGDIGYFSIGTGLSFSTTNLNLHPSLQSISGLTTLADRMIYTTASNTYAVTPFTGFARTLLDDANASTARGTLDVDQAGTDNSTDVTLAGALDYLTITGQEITRNAIDLTTDVTGVLPDGEFAKTGDWTGTFDGQEGSYYLSRTNHTGSQAISTVTGLQTALDGKQPLDTELTAIAGLTSAANEVPYFTGSGTAALLDFQDDDSFASPTATALASSESIKAYVDANGTTITNDANNRVVTAVGDGTLNAEANLTFDGSDVTLSGDLDISGSIFSPTTASSLAIYGGTSGDGARVFLSGSTAGSANDISLGVGVTTKLLYDNSLDEWNFQGLPVSNVGDLDVDNININGNTISSTNTDGDISLDPNGTGNTNLVSGALEIGGTEAISSSRAGSFTTVEAFSTSSSAIDMLTLGNTDVALRQMSIEIPNNTITGIRFKKTTNQDWHFTDNTGTNIFSITNTGETTINDLSGTGDRIVTANSSGTLETEASQAIVGATGIASSSLNIYSTNSSVINFGDAGSSTAGTISYSHGADNFDINIGGSNVADISDDGIFTFGGTISASYDAAGYAGNFSNDGNNSNRQGILIQCGEDSGSGTLIELRDGNGTNVGEVTFSGTTTTYGTSSDIRMKYKIRPSKIETDWIYDILKDFRWKETGEASTGVIAQELHKHFPLAVSTLNDDYWTVDYGKLTIPLIQVVKQQKEEIDTLKNQLSDLLKRVEKLEK